MTLFLTSSPCDNNVPEGLDLPCIFDARNGFVENLRASVEPGAQLLIIAFFASMDLRNLLADFDGVIIGISAGSMNCADTVYAQPEEPGEAVDPDYQRFIPGLGLTTRNILPHYNQVKDNVLDGLRLFEDITAADSAGHTFYILPDGSYILSRDGDEMLCVYSIFSRIKPFPYASVSASKSSISVRLRCPSSVSPIRIRRGAV